MLIMRVIMQQTRAQRRNEERQALNLIRRSKAPQQAQPRRASGKTQLQLLYGRDVVTAHQVRAGERLYRDFHISGAEPRLTAAIEPSLGGRNAAAVDRRADAYERYQNAMKAVGILAPVLAHVVLFDLPAGNWATSNELPKAHGPARLRAALEALVQHYRG